MPCAGFSLPWLLLLWSLGSRHVGSVVAAHGLRCPAACGIFSNQRLNPCSPHWQADFFFFNFYVVLGCAGSSLLHRSFSSCSEQGLLSSCSAWASHRRGFSCCGARSLEHVGLRSCHARALEHMLNSCDAWAYLLCRMWDLPRPGIEPASPALAGRFFTTEPPEKPGRQVLNHWATREVL